MHIGRAYIGIPREDDVYWKLTSYTSGVFTYGVKDWGE